MRDIPDVMSSDTVTVAIRMKLDTREMILCETMKRGIEISYLIREAIRYALENDLDLSKIEDPDQSDVGILRGVTMTFKVSRDFLTKWDEYIAKFDISRSIAVRKAIYHYITVRKPRNAQITAKIFRIKL